MSDGQMGPVEAAVAEDVEGLATASLREAARAVARSMDETTSARDMASLSRELRAVLSEIGVDDVPEADGVDDLAALRAARRAAASGAVGS